jgi:hypothetical protein
MCSAPKIPPPVMPTQYAAMKAPNRAAVQGAGDRMSDTIRSASPTILTSPMGVTQSAQTASKTLLGA